MTSDDENNVTSAHGISVPDVDFILAAAKELPPPKIYRPLHEYGEAIHIMLNEKNMTYSEIADWFYERGFRYTKSSFSNAYKTWCAINGKV